MDYKSLQRLSKAYSVKANQSRNAIIDELLLKLDDNKNSAELLQARDDQEKLENHVESSQSNNTLENAIEIEPFQHFPESFIKQLSNMKEIWNQYINEALINDISAEFKATLNECQSYITKAVCESAIDNDNMPSVYKNNLLKCQEVIAEFHNNYMSTQLRNKTIYDEYTIWTRRDSLSDQECLWHKLNCVQGRHIKACRLYGLLQM